MLFLKSPMTDVGAEIKMSITLVSGLEIEMPLPSFEGEKVQQLRVRLAEHMKVPIGQVAMLCGVELLRDAQTLGTLPRTEGLCEVTVMVSKKWEEKLQDLLVNPYHFSHAGIASIDGALIASSKGSEARLQKPENYVVQDALGADATVNEAECIQFVMEKGSTPETGLWLAGRKFRILRHDLEDEPYTTLLAVSSNFSRDGLGMVAISTGSNILLCRFDEPGENLYAILGSKRKNAAAFADLMRNEGM